MNKKSNWTRDEKLGCGCCLAPILAIVILIIVFALSPDTPKDPNYQAGYEIGRSLANTIIEADVRMHGPNIRLGPVNLGTDDERLQVARMYCPSQLDFAARDQWIKGFLDGY
jgi:hypothetical protein